jgi:hypothetical protein
LAVVIARCQPSSAITITPSAAATATREALMASGCLADLMRGQDEAMKFL